jgi:hypothetical protein
MNGRMLMVALAVMVIFFCQNIDAQQTVAPKKSTANLEETLNWLQRNFETNFTYGYSTLETSSDTATANHHNSIVNRIPVRFENCDLSWREGDDVVSVSLKDLDPLSPAVRSHVENNSTFDSEVWELGMFTRDRKKLITVQRGEGTARSLSDVTLLYDNQENANKFARVFKHAIELCTEEGRPRPN